jgi:hypothetical protein
MGAGACVVWAVEMVGMVEMVKMVKMVNRTILATAKLRTTWRLGVCTLRHTSGRILKRARISVSPEPAD